MVEKLRKMIAGLIQTWQKQRANNEDAAGETKALLQESQPQKLQSQEIHSQESKPQEYQPQEPYSQESKPLSDIAPKKQEKEKNSSVACLTERVNTFLLDNYDFRYNVLTEETEFRPADGHGCAFRPIGKRELNTFCMEAHAKGIACWDKDVSRYIYSTCIAEYHPFKLYMEELPGWDGTDRLTELALKVADTPLWVQGFHRWMLALAAQWLGRTGIHANSVAPILVSSEQGRQKSTFCKALMPQALQRYYVDNLKLTSQGQAERLLAEMGLVNMDEFDKYPAAKMPLLKNLMQMAHLNICKAYQRNYRNLPRIASFIGTSNRFDLLTDPTGSRRFLCIEVKQNIDCTGIDHTQIFAQLKTELEAGERYWFTKEEEHALQEHNAAFYRTSTAEDVFHSNFRAAQPTEQSLDLTAADIFKELQSHNASALRGYNPNRFAQLLMGAGIVRKHTEYGNVYKVVRR